MEMLNESVVCARASSLGHSDPARSDSHESDTQAAPPRPTAGGRASAPCHGSSRATRREERLRKRAGSSGVRFVFCFAAEFSPSDDLQMRLSEADGYIGIKDFRGDLIRLFQGAGFIYHSEVCIWKDPVTAMQRTKALGLLHKQLKKDSCMSRMGLADYVVTMRKPGENERRVSHTNESFPVSEWQDFASPVWWDVNQSNTLQRFSAREEQDEKHICPLQLDVIERCVRLWSNAGDVVFTPFAGIGSEVYEAVLLGRFGIGVELKGSYFRQAVANARLAEVELGQLRLDGVEFLDERRPDWIWMA